MCSSTISIEGILGEGDLAAAVLQKRILALREENTRAMLSIDSEGGSIDDVIDIVAFCRYFEIPFDTCAAGKVCSAAFLLFCYGERRLAMKNAEFWYHRPSHYVHGHDDDVAGIGRYLEFRESAVINEVVRRALAYQSESDAENSMLSIPLLMKAGVVTEVV
jgi:putative cofactor-binding repeat protein